MKGRTVGRKRYRLIERRKEVGLSQEGLAEAAGVDRSTAARWERGESEPQPLHRAKLAKALGVSIHEVGALLTSDSPMVSADGDLASVVKHADQVDLVGVAQLRERVYELDGRYVSTPPTSLLAETGQCLSQAANMKSRTAAGRVQNALQIAEAEAAILMGQLIWDASQRRDHAAARACFTQAVTAARECHDHFTEAWGLLRTTIVVLYGEKDPKAALALARQTAETARGSNVLTGLAILHAAEAHAMLRRRQDCEQALGEGEALLERARSTDAAIDLLAPTDHARIAGSCYLSLGDARRAQSTLETAAGEPRDTSKANAIVLGNLGLAHLRQRNIDEAVGSVHQAIDVVEQTRGGGGFNLVFGVARELRPWQEVNAVKGLHDRLLNLMASV